MAPTLGGDNPDKNANIGPKKNPDIGSIFPRMTSKGILGGPVTVYGYGDRR